MASTQPKDVAPESLVLRADQRLLEILHAIETGPLRFTDLGRQLKLRPAQVNRALRSLVLGRLIQATIEPGSYPNRIRYTLTSAGAFELKQVRQRLEALQAHPSPAHEREARALKRVLS
ncbi:MAG: winged helix-turn-helix transcriptional regulator [Euryarchaeota archaeon]|nr:winged helix-turn-helix transcriptional regulator [Euryarchaeota archaeon]